MAAGPDKAARGGFPPLPGSNDAAGNADESAAQSATGNAPLHRPSLYRRQVANNGMVDADPSLWLLTLDSPRGHSCCLRVGRSGACKPRLRPSARPWGLGGAQQGPPSREHHLLGRATGRARVRPVHLWPIRQVLCHRLSLALHVDKASRFSIRPALRRGPKVDAHHLDRLKARHQVAVGLRDLLVVCAMSGSAHGLTKRKNDLRASGRGALVALSNARPFSGRTRCRSAPGGRSCASGERTVREVNEARC